MEGDLDGPNGSTATDDAVQKSLLDRVSWNVAQHVSFLISC